jgi:hypothetical protein
MGIARGQAERLAHDVRVAQQRRGCILDAQGQMSSAVREGHEGLMVLLPWSTAISAGNRKCPIRFGTISPSVPSMRTTVSSSLVSRLCAFPMHSEEGQPIQHCVIQLEFLEDCRKCTGSRIVHELEQRSVLSTRLAGGCLLMSPFSRCGEERAIVVLNEPCVTTNITSSGANDGKHAKLRKKM